MYAAPPHAPVTAPVTRTGHVVLAAVLWALTAVSSGFVVLLLGGIGLVVLSETNDPAVLLQLARPAAGAVAAGLVLTGLYFAPGIRRLTPAARMALLGALACPAPLGFTVWIFANA